MASPSSSSAQPPLPVNKHALTPQERQRAQLAKLLKDPTKPAYVPPPPKEKTIRPPREMMKNVQGSSAGAGSGEFHVYKANRRREYERLKLMEEATKKEVETEEFERKRKEREEQANAKTSKNRAKRMKKKERAKGKGKESSDGSRQPEGEDVPIKKRRLVSGNEVVFRMPGGDDDDDDDDGEEIAEKREENAEETHADSPAPQAIVSPKMTIHDSD